MSEEVNHPIEGQIVLLAGAKASVSLVQLSDLLADAQAYLATELDDYERRFEQIDAYGVGTYILADEGYWERIGDAMECTQRETEAVARTHAAQFERDGRRMDREGEFETILEIRDVLMVNPAE